MQHSVCSLSFGQRLRALRIARGFSRQDMADLLGYSCVAYGYYENGTRNPSLDTVVILCDALDVSADYLLGRSKTQNVEFARIADTTGLNEISINALKYADPRQRDVFNLLLAEEPDLSRYYDQPEMDKRWNDPDFVSQQYQEYLEQEAWAAQPDPKSAAKHLADEWARNDHYAAMTPEDWDALHEAERGGNAREIEEMRQHYENVDPEAFGPDFTEEEEQHMQDFLAAEEQKEARKSNLFSALVNFVTYTSGCQIETAMTAAPLTDLHSVRIGTGNGNSIRFPSKEADELMEYLLLQKLLDALRKFKCNFHGSD